MTDGVRHGVTLVRADDGPPLTDLLGTTTTVVRDALAAADERLRLLREQRETLAAEIRGLVATQDRLRRMLRAGTETRRSAGAGSQPALPFAD